MRLLADLFFSFAKISLLTFGGGPAMIPFVVDLAERRGWLSEEEMVDCLTVTQSLPGGVVINMASYIGRRVRGNAGMFVAVAGAVSPAAVVAVAIGLLLGNFLDNPYVSGAVQGARAAAVGLVFAAFIKLGKTILKNPLSWIIAVAVIAVVFVLHVSAVWVIIAGGVFGWIASLVRREGSK